MMRVLKIILTIILLQIFINFSYAWGPLTHMVINDEANKRANLTTDEKYQKIYINAGHMPDTISFYHIYGKKRRWPDYKDYDYAHPFVNSKEEGYKLLDTGTYYDKELDNTEIFH